MVSGVDEEGAFHQPTMTVFCSNLRGSIVLCRRQCIHTVISNETQYIEEWFATIIKDKSFYDEHSRADKKTRCYFYNIDLHGRLFLEDTMPKNIATSIKDQRFLNFFFARIQSALPWKDWMHQQGIPTCDYPFVSPCGAELNFIRPAATPLVFHTWDRHSSPELQLLYGGQLTQPFHPGRLCLSQISGRLYHEIDLSRRRQGPSTIQYGLIRSAVAVTMSDHLVPDPEPQSDQKSGLAFETDGGLAPISWLPADAEPGTWALPITDATTSTSIPSHRTF